MQLELFNFSQVLITTMKVFTKIYTRISQKQLPSALLIICTALGQINYLRVGHLALHQRTVALQSSGRFGNRSQPSCNAVAESEKLHVCQRRYFTASIYTLAKLQG